MTTVPGPWDDDIILREDCGCVVMRSPVATEGVMIVYCPLHSAAGEMRDVCEAIIDLYCHTSDPMPVRLQIAARKADAALAKARGEDV